MDLKGTNQKRNKLMRHYQESPKLNQRRKKLNSKIKDNFLIRLQKSDCRSLKELNLSNFNANNVKYMESILKGSSSLVSLICTDYSIHKRYKK